MKKQIILGSFLALSIIGNAQIYTPSGVIQGSSGNNHVGIGGLPTTTRKLQVYPSGLDNGIEVLSDNTGANPNNHDAQLILNNRTTDGHVYYITSEGSGHSPNVPGSLSIWDGTSNASRMFISASGNVGFGSQSPDYSKILAISQTYNSTLPNPSVHRNGGRFEITSSVPGTFIGTSGYANTTSGVLYGYMVGAYGEAQTIGGSATNLNRGVWGVAGGGAYNYGGYFEATGGSANGTGIYATATGGASAFAAEFNGRVEITGNFNVNGVAACTAMNWTSDQKLKKDIKTLTNAIDKIRLLNPTTYYFKTDEFKPLNLPDTRQLGLIAQELEKVFPELVSELKGRDHVDKTGKVTETTPDIKVVNYIGLIPVLISGIQEQQKQIENLQARLAASENQSSATGINQSNTTISGFALDQNIPNPFSNETVINYTLPQEVKTASLIVYDLAGKQLTSFPLEQTTTSITITSEKLAAGIYIYSVMADGKIMDSKRMVVADKH